MSREDFVAVAARLFSVYLLFYIVSRAPATIHAISQSGDFGLTAMSGFAFAVLLALAISLWAFPLTIARKLLPVMREPRSEAALSPSVALSIGLTLIGIWFLANSIVDASYWLTLLVRVARSNEVAFEWSHEQIAGMVATAVQLTVALALVFGSSGIKNLIHRYRYGVSDAR